MNKLFFIIMAGLLIAACSHKTVPAITDRKPSVFNLPEAKTMNIKADTAMGHILFTNRCGRCHALPDPGKYTAARMESLLVFMIPRARMDTVQGVHVKAWLASQVAPN